MQWGAMVPPPPPYDFPYSSLYDAVVAQLCQNHGFIVAQCRRPTRSARLHDKRVELVVVGVAEKGGVEFAVAALPRRALVAAAMRVVPSAAAIASCNHAARSGSLVPKVTHPIIELPQFVDRATWGKDHIKNKTACNS